MTLTWRIKKLKRGDYASGAKLFEYGCPPDDLLSFVKHITDQGGFQSMAVDVFETSDGQYFVNELQTTFKIHVDDGLPMKDGRPGCMRF